jgi:hypothetical protein
MTKDATTSEAGALRVKRRHSAHLLGCPGVVGVGVEKSAEGGFVLAIHLSTDTPEVRQCLPERIEGYPVKIIASGPYRKLTTTRHSSR